MSRTKGSHKAAVILPILLACAILAASMAGMSYCLLTNSQAGTKVDSQMGPKAESDTAGTDVKAGQSKTAMDIVKAFASEQHLSIDDYPAALLDLLERNPETKDFVLHYPLRKDAGTSFSMEEYRNCTSVPLLMQWDERWGYRLYGEDMLGLTGCGPTALSMVAIYRLGDIRYTPAYIADFSVQNGFYVSGNGTAWTLMSDGARRLGLDAVEIPLDETRIIQNLKAGNPIICIMGPGDFTTSGHYIVMVGYKDGKIRINDCNSRARSEMLWEYDQIKSQIRNLWVYRA